MLQEERAKEREREREREREKNKLFTLSKFIREVKPIERKREKKHLKPQAKRAKVVTYHQQ